MHEDMTKSPPVTLTVVAPMFNEARSIAEFCKRLKVSLSELNCSYQVVLVDDGSTDSTVETVKNLDWQELLVVQLFRNVGHQRAIDAGLAAAQGRYLVTLDSDGQHPPELVPSMLETAISSGVDVVYMRQQDRSRDSFWKRRTALLYYQVVRALTGVPIADSQADFRLMRREVLNQIKSVKGDRTLRILLPYLGFKSRTLMYRASPRLGGRSRYSAKQQVALAVRSILDFSARPLKLVATMALVLAMATFAWLALVLTTWLTQGTVAGWASVMTAVLLVGSMSLAASAIIGAYLARIYEIIKGYPRFLYHDETPPTQSVHTDQDL